jgi:glycosyltransferase involved in cell wall biosynthesis
MIIAVLNNLYYPNCSGGAGRSTQLIVNELENKKDVKTIVITTTDKDDYVDEVDNVKIYYVNTGNIYWVKDAKERRTSENVLWHLVDQYNVVAKSKIKRIFRKEKIDILHTNNISGFSVSVWDVASSLNIPIVHTLRDYHLLCIKSTMFHNGKRMKELKMRCRIHSRLKRRLSDKVDAVTGISNSILETHKRYNFFKNAKEYVIHNPVMADEDCLVDEREMETVNLGIVCGRISPAKGVDKFLEEVFVPVNLPDVSIEVFGKGYTKKYMQYLKNKYRTNSNIKFVGFKKQEEIYRSLNLLVVPSLWDEPFGRIIIEANSYGVPVFANKVGGIPELIKDINGKLFNLDVPEGAQKAFREIVRQVREGDFDSKQICRYSTRWGVKEIGCEYKRVYDALL